MSNPSSNPTADLTGSSSQKGGPHLPKSNKRASQGLSPPGKNNPKRFNSKALINSGSNSQLDNAREDMDRSMTQSAMDIRTAQEGLVEGQEDDATMDEVRSGEPEIPSFPVMYVTGTLLVQLQQGGAYRMTTPEQPLVPTFNGGFDSLPAFENRMSAQEWKLIQEATTRHRGGRQNRNANNSNRSPSDLLPPLRKDVIAQETIRFRIPPKLQVGPKEFDKHNSIKWIITQELRKILTGAKLTAAQINDFLSIRPVYMAFHGNKSYINIKWSAAPHIPTISRYNFSVLGHDCVYAGSGQMHPDNWVSICIRNIPPEVSGIQIQESVSYFVEPYAILVELWRMELQDSLEVEAAKTYTSNYVCVLELVFDDRTSNSIAQWRESLFGYIKMAGKCYELSFLGRLNWCRVCQDPDGDRHFHNECPLNVCNICHQRGHYSRTCPNQLKSSENPITQ